MAEAVLIGREEGILSVSINRPEAKNACNRAVAEGISQAMETLDADDTLHAAVLTGAGGTFCAGMDLKAFLQGELPIVEGKGFGGLCEKPPKKPLIAAVEGYALAGGFELCLACDLAVAAENAQFGIPEVRRGLVAAAGGLIRLPRMIPRRFALELALTGASIGAGRAYEMGLVNRITPPGEALEGALEIARQIMANGPLAVATSKSVILESADWPSDKMFAHQADIVVPIFSSADAQEGAAAFAEKRPPRWQGK